MENRIEDSSLPWAAAQAFKEPMLTADGSVKAAWVKRPVSEAEYRKRYQAMPGYRFVTSREGLGYVIYVLPLHLIDNKIHQLASRDEVAQVGRPDF